MKFIEPVGRELKLLGKVTVNLFALVTLLMIFEYSDVFGVETACPYMDHHVLCMFN